jgi:archaellum biogenesis ATPase FlaH
MNYYTPSAERPADIERIRAQARGVPYRPGKAKAHKERPIPTPEDCHSLFTIERGNRWLDLARREPEAKQLLGELWHQDELCMLFADTNIGKSVLAVQIGESIARGQSVGPFACKAEPERVAYFDFELTRRQFLMRYSKGNEDYRFSDDFYRAEFNFAEGLSPDVDENELLIAAIEYKINRVNAKIVILDNITCLRGGTENSAVALSLMKSLKALKTTNKLSILVLAHTPKRRNSTKPISADDLHGSKLLVNFADSVFTLGKSSAESGLCYLKQIKQRNTRQRYGEDNVCLCRLEKPGTFLQFKFDGYSNERHHLLTRTAADRLHLADEIAAFSAEGYSQRDISDRLGISAATVNRALQKMGGGTDKNGCADGEGCADMQMCGCADGEKDAKPRIHGAYNYRDADKNEHANAEEYRYEEARCTGDSEALIDQEDENMDEEEEHEAVREYIHDGTSGPMPGLWPEYEEGGIYAPIKPAADGTYKTTQIDEKLTPGKLEHIKEVAKFIKSIIIVRTDGSSEPFATGGKPGFCP